MKPKEHYRREKKKKISLQSGGLLTPKDFLNFTYAGSRLLIWHWQNFSGLWPWFDPSRKSSVSAFISNLHCSPENFLFNLGPPSFPVNDLFTSYQKRDNTSATNLSAIIYLIFVDANEPQDKVTHPIQVATSRRKPQFPNNPRCFHHLVQYTSFNPKFILKFFFFLFFLFCWLTLSIWSPWARARTCVLVL